MSRESKEASMTQHTPGRWIASQYMDTAEWGILSENNVIVVGLSSRISEANARLIAAAPEMYQFCREMSALSDPYLKPWASVARALLARIEGEKT